ncbi:hypothetical protein [Maribacter ulvicola]|uniref:Uncharacterized protein n=1 Tax=Maribacter ulvicola TaxID=228959 RepID=A0A1N6ULP5_9FLAO|nr:hypothetical protein [Maribacter ulvicola]SIQ66578.1 hypothetical protein SAMN05421797_102388 [Maribacter ulvicola]
MNLKHKSIFNLIEIFTSKKADVVNSIDAKQHCEHNHISDYYCDSDESSRFKKVFGSFL